MWLIVVLQLMPEPVMNLRMNRAWRILWNILFLRVLSKRKAWHILNRMENVGGDLNAYTNKEETVIYSAFLTEHFGRAFELTGGYCIPLHLSATRD